MADRRNGPMPTRPARPMVALQSAAFAFAAVTVAVIAIAPSPSLLSHPLVCGANSSVFIPWAACSRHLSGLLSPSRHQASDRRRRIGEVH